MGKDHEIYGRFDPDTAQIRRNHGGIFMHFFANRHASLWANSHFICGKNRTISTITIRCIHFNDSTSWMAHMATRVPSFVLWFLSLVRYFNSSRGLADAAEANLNFSSRGDIPTFFIRSGDIWDCGWTKVRGWMVILVLVYTKYLAMNSYWGK